MGPKDQARALATEAESAGGAKCIEGEAVFYLPYFWALVPGHIYSELGIAEFRISHLCEYHFDETADAFDNGQEPSMPVLSPAKGVDVEPLDFPS